MTYILTPSLVLLINSVFESGFFPEAWAERCFVPIHKIGVVDEPNNDILYSGKITPPLYFRPFRPLT